MAQYNFEGDFADIHERQLEFINKVILEQDLQVNKVVFEPVGNPGDNFVANIKRITINGGNGNLQLIAKVAPTHEMLRQTTNVPLMFMNETTMYMEVLPKLVQLQKNAGVPEEDQLKYAMCYGSLSEAPHEIIILEDLNASDFKILDKFVSLSDECVRSVLKNFAMLHSLSYALKKIEPETFDIFKSKLIDMWTVLSRFEEFQKHMQIFENNIIAVLDDESHKETCKNKIMYILQQSEKFAKSEAQSKYSVIQQGDAWTNNIMFKFEGDKLVQSIMIDYQASKNSSPVTDLLYMIFNCTDRETRSKHFYDWLDYYHIELDRSLSNFGLKANFAYPRDQLDADLKRYGKLLFGLCLILANVLMRDSKEAGQMLESMKSAELHELMEKMKTQDLQDATKERLRKRIIGLIDSYKEFGLL